MRAPNGPPTSSRPSGLAFCWGLVGPGTAPPRTRGTPKSHISTWPWAADSWAAVWGAAPAFGIPRGGVLSGKSGPLRPGPASSFLCGPYVAHRDPSSCCPCSGSSNASHCTLEQAVELATRAPCRLSSGGLLSTHPDQSRAHGLPSWCSTLEKKHDES